jgi:hypothetical protein
MNSRIKADRARSLIAETEPGPLNCQWSDLLATDHRACPSLNGKPAKDSLSTPASVRRDPIEEEPRTGVHDVVECDGCLLLPVPELLYEPLAAFAARC